jgi:hypothetical protein
MFLTQSQCPVFLFFYFIDLFFKIPTYWSSADFSGWFRLKGKSVKLLISQCLQFCGFEIPVWGELQSGPPPLNVPLFRPHREHSLVSITKTSRLMFFADYIADIAANVAYWSLYLPDIWNLNVSETCFASVIRQDIKICNSLCFAQHVVLTF